MCDRESFFIVLLLRQNLEVLSHYHVKCLKIKFKDKRRDRDPRPAQLRPGRIRIENLNVDAN